MRSFMIATLLFAAMPPALADEVWTTARGDIVYLEDIGEVAHWVFTTDSVTYDIFLPGLAGNTESRGAFSGYFLVSGSDLCGIEMKGPAGWRSAHWGEVVVDFYEPGFPSGFSFYRGECFVSANHGEALVAEPKVDF